MKKLIRVQELQKGMYVAELDRPWLGTPFMLQGFEIRSDEQLEKLRELCEHVYIEEKDPPVSVAIHRTIPDAKDPTQAHTLWQQTIGLSTGKDSLHTIPTAGTPPVRYRDLAPVEDELQQAVEIEKSARDALYTVLDDAKLGRSLDTPTAKKVVSQMTESVLRNPDALVWLTHLKNKHEYTALHSLRVCVLALAFGRHLGYDSEKLTVLGTGALLHDIGKLHVPVDILQKPETLTREEFQIMKTHVPSGLKVLENSPGIPPAALEVVGRHHERYNGRGYIFGMSGDIIGDFGLISAIVDTYDAITSDRSYRLSLSAADALKIIYEDRHSSFHPWLAEQFIQCMGIYPIGSIVELTSGCIGVVISSDRRHRLRPRVALILAANKEKYASPTLVDLAEVKHDADGRSLEIKTVLPGGAFGIVPTDYIPTPR